MNSNSSSAALKLTSRPVTAGHRASNPSPAPKRILFALTEFGRPTLSLRRADELAARMSAELHVLRVLPELCNLNPIEPHLNIVDTLRAAERTLGALRTTEAWLETTGVISREPGRLELGSGDFVEQVAARAVEIDASFIVLPPREGRFGSTVTALARVARTPVFVARRRAARNSVIAATDLTDPEFPVLRVAAEIGACTEAEVIAVHNASLLPKAALTRSREVSQNPNGEPRSRSFVLLSSTSPNSIRRIDTYASNSADAILDQARTQQADVIVVGARSRSWFERLLGCGVANQVIDEARRSVLVVPLRLER